MHNHLNTFTATKSNTSPRKQTMTSRNKSATPPLINKHMHSKIQSVSGKPQQLLLPFVILRNHGGVLLSLFGAVSPPSSTLSCLMSSRLQLSPLPPLPYSGFSLIPLLFPLIPFSRKRDSGINPASSTSPP